MKNHAEFYENLQKQSAAWILDQSDLYFCSVGLKPNSPDTPATCLIQGLYEKKKDFAMRILRKPIHTNYEPLLICRETARVAAKRIRISEQIELPPDVTLHEIFSPERNVQKNGLKTSEIKAQLQELESQILRQGDLHDCARPIAAFLTAKTGEVLATALNSNSPNKSLHAEVNLMRSYYWAFHEPLPADCSIYVSLKPCRMCAATIAHCASDWKTLKVYYLNDDGGSLSRNTCFDPRSHTRATICRDKNEMDLVVQHLL